MTEKPIIGYYRRLRDSLDKKQQAFRIYPYTSQAYFDKLVADGDAEASTKQAYEAQQRESAGIGPAPEEEFLSQETPQPAEAPKEELPSEYEEIQTEIKDYLLKRERLRAIEITANWILKKHSIKTLRENEEVLFYTRGIYKKGGETIVKEEAEKIWGDLLTNNTSKEIAGHVIRKTYIDYSLFLQTPNIVCLENGLYDLENDTLWPHNPDHYFLTKLPITYDPAASCPEIEKFIESILYPQDRGFFYELAGYLLLRQYPLQKFFVFIGPGGNGKTITINLLLAFIGKENSSSLSMQAIEYERFSLGQLFEKYANLADDLPKKDLTSTGRIKQLCGGSPIDTDQKHKNRLRFYNYAKLIFAANEMPEIRDSTKAFFDRALFISFPNCFRGTEKEIPENILNAKLQNPQEISGLFNKSTKALKDLLKRHKFSNAKTAEDNELGITRMINHVKAFFDEALVPDVERYVYKEDLYAYYQAYCEIYQIPPESKQVLTKKLQQAGATMKEFKPQAEEGESRQEAWKGIYFRPEFYQKLQNNQHCRLCQHFFLLCSHKIYIKRDIQNLSAQTDINQDNQITLLTDAENAPGQPNRAFKDRILEEYKQDGGTILHDDLRLLGQEVGLSLEEVDQEITQHLSTGLLKNTGYMTYSLNFFGGSL